MRVSGEKLHEQGNAHYRIELVRAGTNKRISGYNYLSGRSLAFTGLGSTDSGLGAGRLMGESGPLESLSSENAS